MVAYTAGSSCQLYPRINTAVDTNTAGRRTAAKQQRQAHECKLVGAHRVREFLGSADVEETTAHRGSGLVSFHLGVHIGVSFIEP